METTGLLIFDSGRLRSGAAARASRQAVGVGRHVRTGEAAQEQRYVGGIGLVVAGKVGAKAGARRVERAEAAGISREDIIIDCLTFAVGADPNSGLAVIEAIRRIKAELGVNLTLGASNLSFGLPDRHLLNNTFVAMAVAAGVTCLIVDVAKARPAVLAADLILGRDKHARRYIEDFRQRQRLQERKT